MSNQPKPIRPAHAPAPSSQKRSKSGAAFLVLAVAVVAAFGVWWWRAQHPVAPPAVTPPADSQAANAPPPKEAVAKPEFQKLKGKWLRTDGGYILEIKSADHGSKLDAAYFNPKPINVARAEASLEGTTIKVFIELRDVNYPGSTYTLAYEPGSDQFNGIYYQALQQQRFEVTFVRTK